MLICRQTVIKSKSFWITQRVCVFVLFVYARERASNVNLISSSAPFFSRFVWHFPFFLFILTTMFRSGGVFNGCAQHFSSTRNVCMTDETEIACLSNTVENNLLLKIADAHKWDGAVAEIESASESWGKRGRKKSRPISSTVCVWLSVRGHKKLRLNRQSSECRSN